MEILLVSDFTINIYCYSFQSIIGGARLDLLIRDQYFYFGLSCFFFFFFLTFSTFLIFTLPNSAAQCGVDRRYRNNRIIRFQFPKFDLDFFQGMLIIIGIIMEGI